jgi:DNA (cytosine-5)-methyltransferase 1
MNHSKKLLEVFNSTPINGVSRAQSKRQLPCHKNHNGHKDVYGRIDPKKPGPTITTGCVNPSKGRFLHPTRNHGITVRHAARFQTFPDDFVFSGGLMASAVQIGNAVPIRLGKRVIASVYDALSVESLHQHTNLKGY